MKKYFSLKKDFALVKGAKNSALFDFRKKRVFQLNLIASSILDYGNHGLTIADTIKKLDTEVEASDIITFISRLSKQGFIGFINTKKVIKQNKKQKYNLKMIWIELTSNCNLKCIHCYCGKEEKNKFNNSLSITEIKTLINDASRLGCKNIQFTGGEATLRTDLKEIIEFAIHKSIVVEVFTNGTLITESLANFFSKNNIRVAVSIFSNDPQIHDNITKIKGSHAKTIRGLKILLKHNISIRCSVIIMNQNEKTINETKKFLFSLGIKKIQTDPIRPAGKGNKFENWSTKYWKKPNSFKQTFFVIRKIFEINQKWNSCWVGKAVITPEGDVLPCVFARNHNVGNIRKNSFKDIVNEFLMKNFWTMTKDYIEVCKDCEFRYVCIDCRPWAFGLTKNLYAKSPRCAYDPYTGVWVRGDIKSFYDPVCI